MARTAADVMTSEFTYVDAATKLTRAPQLMADHRIRRFPALNSEWRLIRTIAREDVMLALARDT